MNIFNSKYTVKIQIQSVIYQLKDKHLLDHFLQTDKQLSVTPWINRPLNTLNFQFSQAGNEYYRLCYGRTKWVTLHPAVKHSNF